LSLAPDFLTFASVCSSKNCPVKSVNELMYETTLADFLDIKDYTDVMDSFDQEMNVYIQNKMDKR
jgi:hypothetical protein